MITDTLLFVGVVLLAVRGIPMWYWGVKTNFYFYREREIGDKHIAIEVYEFMGGWKIRSLRMHPKRKAKIMKETIQSDAYKKICERIKTT